MLLLATRAAREAMMMETTVQLVVLAGVVLRLQRGGGRGVLTVLMSEIPGRVAA